MDCFHQNRFKNILILFLAAANLLSLSMLWLQRSGEEEHAAVKTGMPSQAVTLMRKELDLTESQTKKVDELRKNRLEELKKYNDSLAILKKELADELFREKPDSRAASAKAERIGRLQNNVEMIRFHHFKELLAVCTPAQKEKLKPILYEVFGKKPPKEFLPKTVDSPPPPQDTLRADETRQPPKPRPDGRSEERRQPPSIDEKLSRYQERLGLSDAQTEKVRKVLLTSRLKGDELRARPHPDRDEIEAEKEKIRSAEEEAVMNILDASQKEEFRKMLSRKKK